MHTASSNHLYYDMLKSLNIYLHNFFIDITNSNFDETGYIHENNYFSYFVLIKKKYS